MFKFADLHNIPQNKQCVQSVNGTVHVHVADVGRGSCLFIQCSHGDIGVYGGTVIIPVDEREAFMFGCGGEEFTSENFARRNSCRAENFTGHAVFKRHGVFLRFAAFVHKPYLCAVEGVCGADGKSA